MEFTSFKVEDVDYWGATPARMARLMARAPKHTWTPPAGSRPVSQPVARAQASPDNARARRLRRRNGTAWHAQAS